jgi:hypothetical protein
MRSRKAFILLLFLFTSTILFGQQIGDRQQEVAKQFLHLVLKGNSDNCWKLFDEKNVPGVSQQQFKSVLDQMKNDLALFDNFEMTMTGIRMVGDKKLNQYTFKASSKTRNIVDDISVDVLFFDSSQLVAAVQPKKLLKENNASTSSGKETAIENAFMATIDGVSYKIPGINIVNFTNNEAIVAIQVEYALPADPATVQELTKKEAVKFAKYLVKNGYIEKARIKAKEIDRTLLENIGVSFLDPTKGGGYNVLVKPEDYK